MKTVESINEIIENNKIALESYIVNIYSNKEEGNSSFAIDLLFEICDSEYVKETSCLRTFKITRMYGKRELTDNEKLYILLRTMMNRHYYISKLKTSVFIPENINKINIVKYWMGTSESFHDDYGYRIASEISGLYVNSHFKPISKKDDEHLIKVMDKTGSFQDNKNVFEIELLSFALVHKILTFEAYFADEMDEMRDIIITQKVTINAPLEEARFLYYYKCNTLDNLEETNDVVFVTNLKLNENTLYEDTYNKTFFTVTRLSNRYNIPNCIEKTFHTEMYVNVKERLLIYSKGLSLGAFSNYLQKIMTKYRKTKVEFIETFRNTLKNTISNFYHQYIVDKMPVIKDDDYVYRLYTHACFSRYGYNVELRKVVPKCSDNSEDTVLIDYKMSSDWDAEISTFSKNEDENLYKHIEEIIDKEFNNTLAVEQLKLKVNMFIHQFKSVSISTMFIMKELHNLPEIVDIKDVKEFLLDHSQVVDEAVKCVDILDLISYVGGILMKNTHEYGYNLERNYFIGCQEFKDMDDLLKQLSDKKEKFISLLNGWILTGNFLSYYNGRLIYNCEYDFITEFLEKYNKKIKEQEGEKK